MVRGHSSASPTMQVDTGVRKVLVVEAGQIVEDGARCTHRATGFAPLPLEAEEAVRKKLWSSGVWRRLRLEGGRLVEDGVQSDG